jgi:hypothetical protein
MALLCCCVLSAPASARRRRVTVKRQRLYRAMIALGVPRRIARAFRTDGKLPRPSCGKLVYSQRGTHYVVNANTTSTGERGEGLRDLAVVTPRGPQFLKRVLDKRFRQVNQPGRPPVQRYRRRGVEVTHYTYWPMVGDVLGVLGECIGKSMQEIQRDHAVFIIRLVPPPRPPASAPAPAPSPAPSPAPAPAPAPAKKP